MDELNESVREAMPLAATLEMEFVAAAPEEVPAGLPGTRASARPVACSTAAS